MYQSKIPHLVVLLMLTVTSCIKKYEPSINNTDAKKYVITGEVNKGDSAQIINVSTTSPMSKPQTLPVTGCMVTIIDGKGNSYSASDMWEGKYSVRIPESELVSGNSFKVDIIIPGGVHIVSDFDQIQEGSDLDSVYYEVQKSPKSFEANYTGGIQFFVNLNAENTPCRYWRWDAIETYEYHSQHPIEWYYNGVLHHVFPPDSSKMVCWRTSKLRDIYILSTKDLTRNVYPKYPLQFVDNTSSPRLVYGYSLFVRQYALSKAAYDYWEKIRSNNTEQGGLYERQPIAIKGNLHNITNPDQDVLGFFGAADVKQKRIFVKNVPDLSIEYVFNCIIESLPKGGLAGVGPIMYPVYLPTRTFNQGDSIISTYVLLSIDHECVDCTSTVGGTNVKPVFWPY